MLLDQDQKGLLSIRLEREKPGPIQELEKAIEDAVSDLPLGKALHLLLNVHRHVFDKAVDTIQTCDASQLVLAMTDSPTVRAIVSIEHYLLQNDITTSFQHVYVPLKEKILKKNTQANTPAIRIIGYFTLQSKQTTDQVQAILKNELTMMEDKRSQLACVVLLQSLFSHVAGKERHDQFIIDLVPLLIHIAEKQSKPTLLACSSCELAIQLLQSILTQPAHPIIGNTKIQVVEEVNTINHLSTSWHQIGRVLFVLEKWHAQKGPLEAAAYQQLHQILQHKDHLLMWNELFVWLTPKAVATEKPISFKKQKKILASVHLQFAKLVVLTLLQKGEWYHLSTVHSTEQDEIETHIQEEYNTLLSMDSPFLVLLPSLIATLPHLFSTENVCHPALIQTILDQTTDTTSIKRLVPMVLKEPESPICNALWHIAQQDDRADFSFRLLTCLIQQDSESVLSILQGNLIPLIKSSDKACELLIECMSFIRLPILIQKLMKKAIQAKENERERMTYIALISKALLHETWKSDSILYYIELLRLASMTGRDSRTHMLG
ncbi:uncharacterized protein B0P05DRAFT_541886 [Gilbertella persicaria]|uniref:Uncharacterized protein n=1 Tax=Rhizopus stolonifer TaxID=4846 RepID=A0A367KWX5_RHIST|nr:uncharacterized protein B0P05DRAFT_541886 [Gilbertella persicaria]KAI8078967.1 hypothetical protein B0P05DRAFT_541886 [Gilbertella persicaria]RCI06696.1 hypothetical protein CU098_012260 [Rhizopus stolonifer]